jgi:capsid portal protein
LQSVINGISDYVIGKNVITNNIKFNDKVNKDGETLSDILQRLVIDYLIFGGFAIQVIRNALGNVNELYWVDFSKLRTTKKNDIIYFSEDWTKSYGRVKVVSYPRFRAEDVKNATSIYYFKGNKTRGTYPTPLWNAAIKYCEIEKIVADYHLNELNNNFLSSKIVNFNSGVPADELKEEIEKTFTEKFTGYQNAGRVLLSFNNSKDNEASVTSLGEDGYAERYTNLVKRSREQIFVAFRAIPCLFGLPTENSGFNREEFTQAYNLLNETMVEPIQKIFIKTFKKILGEETEITITPLDVMKNE